MKNLQNNLSQICMAFLLGIAFFTTPSQAQSTSKSQNNLYQVYNQWGGSSAPWNGGGVWIIGGRSGQSVVSLNISSSDNGTTLNGTMTYAGEGPIGFRASLTQSNTYVVENQWGGAFAPWNPGGTWLLGGRVNQNVVAINISSADNGDNFTGTMTYAGEGPISFKSEGIDGGVYDVENQWGGPSAPWNDGGVWIIGGRSGQSVIALNISSSDNGTTLNGTMAYAGEGAIGFRASLTQSNTYVVENQWGGSSAPWNPGGTWLLGGRVNQNVVAIVISSSDNGDNLTGTMTYAGEGPIAFRATQRQAQSTGTEELAGTEIPVLFKLEQNYPNPFNPITNIQFSLPQASPVALEIYNIMGKQVRILAREEMSAGQHTLQWNGTNNFGASVASGIYIYRLKAGKFITSRQMMLMK